jgi:hypothetical protein
MDRRDIAVLIMAARSNRYRDLVKHVPDCEAALTSIQPGQLVYVPFPAV